MMRLVLLMVVGLPWSVAESDLDFVEDCLVRPSFSFNISKNPEAVTFWGHIGSDKDSTPAKRKIQETDTNGHGTLLMALNFTHITITESKFGENGVKLFEVDENVTPGWRQFEVVVSGGIVSLVDTHGITWFNISFSQNISRVVANILNFNDSCYALTPTWMAGDFAEAVDVPVDDEVLVTLVGDGAFLPRLSLLDTNLTVSLAWNTTSDCLVFSTTTTSPHTLQPLPPHRPHRLLITSNASAVASAGYEVTVMATNGYTRLNITNLGRGSFYLIQHIHLTLPTTVQSCEGTTSDAGDNEDSLYESYLIAIAAFNWIVCVFGAITYCCYKRIMRELKVLK